MPVDPVTETTVYDGEMEKDKIEVRDEDFESQGESFLVSSFQKKVCFFSGKGLFPFKKGFVSFQEEMKRIITHLPLLERLEDE